MIMRILFSMEYFILCRHHQETQKGIVGWIELDKKPPYNSYWKTNQAVEGKSSFLSKRVFGQYVRK